MPQASPVPGVCIRYEGWERAIPSVDARETLFKLSSLDARFARLQPGNEGSFGSAPREQV